MSDDTDDRELRRIKARNERLSIIIAMIALVVAIAGNAVTSVLSVQSLQQTAQHFQQSSHAGEYNEIIHGLTSSSPAVQINSVRRLTTFVTDSANFKNGQAQRDGVTTAVQTLVAFVKDEAPSTNAGVTSWHQPQPPAVGPALTKLNQLASDRTLGANSIDLAQVDMHGMANLAGFRPGSGVFLTGADLRRSDLAGVSLKDRQAVLRRVFLTCADLRGADLGDADVEYADLSGADLRGTDLGGVRNLTVAQLTGATVDSATRLPAGLQLQNSAIWSAADCARYTVGMTGLRSGAGYDPDTPCPATEDAYMTASPGLGPNSEAAAIIEVCSAREP